MDSPTRMQALQKAIRPKFRGHATLNCKRHARYPEGPEREYQRATIAYMKLLNEVVRKHMPEIIKAAQTRADSADDGDRQPPDNGIVSAAALSAVIDDVFGKIARELTERITKYGLRQKLESFANRTRKLTVREWKKAVHATLGIDIMEDYYNGEKFERLLREWIDQNVDLITTIPKDTLGDMKKIVREGFLGGKPTENIAQEIQRRYNTGSSRARLIARDQIAKLNGQLTEMQQCDAGVREYTWSTVGDSRVRKSHRKLHGTVQSWDAPPDVGGGRHLHPGRDYQCRCEALPRFNLEDVDLPWENGLTDFVSRGSKSRTIPDSGFALQNLAKELKVSATGSDREIKDRVVAKFKAKRWKHP